MYETQTAVSNEKSAIATSPLPASQEPVSEVPASRPMEEEISTRFGKVTVKRDNPVIFPKGLLGFSGHSDYCLLDFPVEKFGQLKLLQSIEEDDLSFITLPLEVENPIIERTDIEAACKELGFPVADTALLLIVSVHREPQQVRLSANARAPLFIHAPQRKAEQYVMHNNKYLVRHMLTE